MIYPDLEVPAGWRYRQVGSQIWLVPPDGGGEAETAIVVAPVLSRHDRLPAPERLIAMALEAEEQARFAVTRRGAPAAVAAQGGLSGVAVEVSGYARPDGPAERRIYVMYVDDRCYYGINFLAREADFARHADAFWAAARSLRPFAGAAQPAASAEAGAAPSPVGNYAD